MPTIELARANGLRSFRYLGIQVTVHADSSDTNGQFSVLEFHSVPGAEPPMHVHDNEDEIFIVLDGQMKVNCGGVEKVLSPGDSAVARRGTPHTFQILTPALHSLAIFTPAGFEEFFRTIGAAAQPSFEQIGQVAARLGTRFV
jgi:quercetin dioxygenase-like cupin family protein